MADLHFRKMVLTRVWRTHFQVGMNGGREARISVLHMAGKTGNVKQLVLLQL